MLRKLLIVLLACATFGAAQSSARPAAAPKPAAVVSPEVQSDNRVTFQFRDPNAQEVLLWLEGSKPVPMQKNEEGVWRVTVGPLDPDFYGYSFIADEVELIDPLNWHMKPNMLSTQSELHVPGASSLPLEENDVPHGVVHHHFYKSGLIRDQRDFYVYTPPGYDGADKTKYPVLYLLHGFSDDASAWAVVGRANMILDNLIASGKARPMLVVMPLGYGAPEIVSRGFGGFDDDRALRTRNFDNFRTALLTEVIPLVEKNYQIATGPDARAIAGLSMGGSESLLTGLNNLDKFAWIGAFSSGGLPEDFNSGFPTLTSDANSKLRLLWIACGIDDHLMKQNRDFHEWLASKGIRHKDIETSGAHTWMVWRRNLATFAPLLFK